MEGEAGGALPPQHHAEQGPPCAALPPDMQRAPPALLLLLNPPRRATHTRTSRPAQQAASAHTVRGSGRQACVRLHEPSCAATLPRPSTVVATGGRGGGGVVAARIVVVGQRGAVVPAVRMIRVRVPPRTGIVRGRCRRPAAHARIHVGCWRGRGVRACCRAIVPPRRCCIPAAPGRQPSCRVPLPAGIPISMCRRRRGGVATRRRRVAPRRWRWGIVPPRPLDVAHRSGGRRVPPPHAVVPPWRPPQRRRHCCCPWPRHHHRVDACLVIWRHFDVEQRGGQGARPCQLWVFCCQRRRAHAQLRGWSRV